MDTNEGINGLKENEDKLNEMNPLQKEEEKIKSTVVEEKIENTEENDDLKQKINLDEIKKDIGKALESTIKEFCKEYPNQIIFKNDKKNEEVKPIQKEDENDKSEQIKILMI